MVENQNELKTGNKYMIIPIISIFIFGILVFTAGYAYFSVGSNVMDTSEHHATLPLRTSLSCSGVPDANCALDVTYASMVSGKKGNLAANTDPNKCFLNCTCTGSSGGYCNYTIKLETTGSGEPQYVYTPTAGATISSNKEYTAVFTMGAGCSVQNSSTSENQVNNYAGKIIASCNIAATPSGNSSITKVKFSWYNNNLVQDEHAGKTYIYRMSSNLVSLT